MYSMSGPSSSSLLSGSHQSWGAALAVKPGGASASSASPSSSASSEAQVSGETCIGVTAASATTTALLSVLSEVAVDADVTLDIAG